MTDFLEQARYRQHEFFVDFISTLGNVAAILLFGLICSIVVAFIVATLPIWVTIMWAEDRIHKSIMEWRD